MRVANLALKFLLELAAFTALAYVGAIVGSGVWSVVLAVALPAAAIAIWARWNAPKAARRLPTRARAPLELGIFVVAGVGLFMAGAAVWAALYLALVVINAILLSTLRQWEA